MILQTGIRIENLSSLTRPFESKRSTQRITINMPQPRSVLSSKAGGINLHSLRYLLFKTSPYQLVIDPSPRSKTGWS